MKSGSARDLEQFVTTFYNPEVAAMAAIVEILDELPDPAARLRVMRWAFAKYSDEFKRPLPDAPAAGEAPAPVPTGPVLVLSSPRPSIKEVELDPIPVPAAAPAPERSIAEDIEDQIAELNDLFPASAATPIDL
ncbi:MAG TPA: hypothetical protein VF147_08815 [Vicinamibacterales bacterium]